MKDTSIAMKKIFNFICFFLILSIYLYILSDPNLYLINFRNNNLGENKTIAYLDSGIDEKLYTLYSHRIVGLFDATMDNGNPLVDKSGHGTSMVVIGCNNDEVLNIQSFAPNSKILIVKIFDKIGNCFDSYIAKGIDYAIDNNASVINFSFSGKSKYPLREAAINRAYDKKIIMVGSVGNNSNDYLFPCNNTKVLSVGNEHSTNPNITITIPSDNTKSVVVIDDVLIYSNLSGTSCSASIASSIIVSLISRFSEEQFNNLRSYLYDESTHLSYMSLLVYQGAKL
jgi:subtilisin